MQTNIILTKTFVDQKKLQQGLAYIFFNKGSLTTNLLSQSADSDSQEFFTQKESQGRIISMDFNQKKDYKKSLLSLYEQREEPTLLFLGDLDKYSLPLQEGMLRLLEEPPHNLYIVLFSQNLSNILPTISSRSVIHSLSQKYIFDIVDQSLLGKVQAKLPPVKETVKNMLTTNYDINIENITKIEREEISFWLWQINEYLSAAFAQNPSKAIAAKINSVLQAIQYNNQNLQKKFLIESLGY